MNNNRKIKKLKRFTHKMQAKTLLVFCVVIMVLCVLLGRIVYLNNKDGEKYEKRVLSQQTYVSSVIPYKRGEIRDCKGTVLARSEAAYNLVLDVKQMLSKEAYKEPTLSALEENFQITREELEKIVKEKSDKQYVVLKKKMSFDEIAPFQELQEKNKNIKGVWFEKEYLRKYAYDKLASDVIGFTSSGNVGQWGLEQYYNSILNGVNGREYGYFDSELNLDRNVKKAENGKTIVTSLDANIQQIVEKHINAYAADPGCLNVAAIVYNPKNGEVIAMASKDQYNLNDPWNLEEYYTKKEIEAMNEEEKINALSKIWRNYCISDTYEPGSTFKPFTVAAGLEESILSQTDTFVCDGGQVVIAGEKPIKCSNRLGHGTITLEESLMKSCNDALIQIAEKEGRTIFSKYQDLFNFGKRTGIDLYGEGSGLVFNKEQLNASELATSSFGQSLTVNMVQMVAGFSALINGGYYYQPHIVKQILNDNDSVVKNIEPVVMKEVVSAETSEFIKKAMFETVEAGTAGGAKVEGYTIGGKTGTAQKHPITTPQRYLVSFIGFAPASDPSVVIYVIIDEPNEEKQANSAIATKMASRIMKDILPFLEIYPSDDIELIPSHTVSPDDEEFDGAVLPDDEEEDTSLEGDTSPE